MSYEKLSYFFTYTRIVTLFEGSKEIYIITFYFCVFVMFVITTLIIFYSISLAKNSIRVLWPITLLKTMLGAISSFMYIPLFEIFISMMKCRSQDEIIRTYWKESGDEDLPFNNFTSNNNTFNNHTDFPFNDTILNDTILNNTVLNDTLLNNQTLNNITENATRLLRNLVQYNYIAPDIQCYQGIHFLHAFIGILSALMLFIICLLVKATLFETKLNTANPNTKFSSYNDKMLLISKSLLCIFYCFFGKESNDWILAILTFVLALILFYLYIELQPHNDPSIQLITLFELTIFLWGCGVLVIAQVFKGSEFDGGIALFFIGIPALSAIMITYNKNNYDLLLMEIPHSESVNRTLKKIRYFIELINNRENNRKANIIIKGYVELYESKCAMKVCAFKRYLDALSRGEEATAFLYQHVEYMFQLGLSRFPRSAMLRTIYSFFQLENLNKKTEANQELELAEGYCSAMEEEFIIFRAKKVIEEETLDIGDSAINGGGNDEKNNNGEGGGNVDILTSIAYKKYLATFKTLINKVSLLYIDFWSLLLNPNQDSKHLARLNDFGTKINLSVEELRSTFEKIQKIKHNDREVICYYSDFLNDILNDKEEAIKLKKIIDSEDAKQPYDDSNYFNLDLNALASSDEYQYIIVSGKAESFGIITNISLGVCLILGYTRDELIGKSYDIFMPEIYQIEHRDILKEKISDYKKDMFNMVGKKSYKAVFKDVHTYVKNKARYLVSLLFKVALICNEASGIVFVAKVYNNFTTNNGQNTQSLNISATPMDTKLANKTEEISESKLGNNTTTNNIANNLSHTCVILTNNALIIQNFTSNALTILGLNSNYMRSTIDVTSMIKQFTDEMLKNYAAGGDQSTIEQKLVIKRQLIKTRFKGQTLINWKYPDERKKHKEEKKSKSNITDIDDSTLLTKNKLNLFHMNIQDAFIRGKQVGYVFIFDEAVGLNITGIKNSNMNCSKISQRKPNASALGTMTGNQMAATPGGNNVNKEGETPNPNETPIGNEKEDKNKMQTIKEEESQRDEKKAPETSNIPGNNNDLLLPLQNREVEMHVSGVPGEQGNSGGKGNEFYNDVTGSFIPMGNKNFQFDLPNISYKINPNNPNQLREFIRNEAMAKVDINNLHMNNNQNNKRNRDEDGEGEGEEEEDEEEEEDDEENEHDESNEGGSRGSSQKRSESEEEENKENKSQKDKQSKQPTQTNNLSSVKEPKPKKTFQQNLQDENSFYPVDMTNIKLLIYNYQSKTFVEVTNFEKISQVDKRRYEDGFKKANTSASNNEKNENIEEKGKEKKEENEQTEYKTPDAGIITDQNSLNSAEKKNILIKQIEYSLAKQDSQPELTKLKWISLVFFVLLAATDGILIYEIYTSIRNIKENFVLIKNSYGLVLNCLFTVSNIRELVLLSFDDYNNTIFGTKQDDINKIKEETNDYYFESHELITYIITTFLKVTDEHQKYLYETLINVNVLKEDNTTNTYKMPLSNGFIETNTAIFHITNDTDIDKYYPTNIYIFFYIENSFNEIMTGLNEQANIFTDEILLKIKNQKLLFILSLIGIFIVLLVGYLLMSWGYGDVAKKKESYLEVFFEIGTGVIKNSLEKCEKFTKKIQAESFSEFLSNATDEVESLDGDALKYKNEQNELLGLNKQTHNKMQFSKNSRETVLIKVYLGVIVLVIYVLYIVIVIIVSSTFNRVKILVTIYQNQNLVMIQYTKVYNYLREFLFYNQSRIELKPIDTFLDDYTNYFFKNVHVNEAIVFNYKSDFPADYDDIYMRIYHSTLCDKELGINLQENCDTDMFTATRYGLNVLLASFIEEIRCLKTDAALKLDKNSQEGYGFVYNFTQIDMPIFQERIQNYTKAGRKEKYEEFNPFQLFNTEEAKNMKKIYYLFVKTCFKKLYNTLSNSITDYINSYSTVFIGVLAGILVLIMILFLGVWKPFEVSLKNLIFKTKNMLGIIPKDVLASLANIQSLLGINQNLKKNSGAREKKG